MPAGIPLDHFHRWGCDGKRLLHGISIDCNKERCPALPKGVQPSPWEKGKHPHPLSQILRICQLPRKGELLTHPQGLHFIWKLRRYCKKLPLRGSWRTNVSLRGFSMLKANEKAYSTAPRFRRKRRCNAVSLYDPICEKAIQENPQIFLNCNYKINFPLNMPREERRAFKIVPA